MCRWIRSLFAWRVVRNSGVWLYEENTVTGRRRAIRISRCGQPLNFEWLGGGTGAGKVIDITAGANMRPHGVPPSKNR